MLTMSFRPVAPQKPSCQGPSVNPTLADHADALLARLFRYGTISYHGTFVIISSIAAVQTFSVNPNYWRRLRNRSKTEPGMYAQARSLVLIRRNSWQLHHPSSIRTE
jgi:hypothetical protein